MIMQCKWLSNLTAVFNSVFMRKTDRNLLLGPHLYLVWISIPIFILWEVLELKHVWHWFSVMHHVTHLFWIRIRYLKICTRYRGAQIPGTRSPKLLNFGWWCLIFVGPQYGTCFMWRLWHQRILKWLLEPDIVYYCTSLPPLFITLIAWNVHTASHDHYSASVK
jgi:hypothetical protein